MKKRCVFLPRAYDKCRGQQFGQIALPLYFRSIQQKGCQSPFWHCTQTTAPALAGRRKKEPAEHTVHISTFYWRVSRSYQQFSFFLALRNTSVPIFGEFREGHTIIPEGFDQNIKNSPARNQTNTNTQHHTKAAHLSVARKFPFSDLERIEDFCALFWMVAYVSMLFSIVANCSEEELKTTQNRPLAQRCLQLLVSLLAQK